MALFSKPIMVPWVLKTWYTDGGGVGDGGGGAEKKELRRSFVEGLIYAASDDFKEQFLTVAILRM